jgi:hypothetical protein
VTSIASRDFRTTRDFPSSLPLQIAASAVALGLLADALFNGAALGVNLPLWLIVLVAAFVLIARRNGRPIGPLAGGMLGAGLLLSMLTAWRADPALQAVLLGASAALLLLAFVTHGDLRARGVTITLFAGSLASGAISTIEGLALLPQSLPWRAWIEAGPRQHARTAGRALLLATPLVLVFGGLFFAADAVFEAWTRNAAALDLTAVADHLRWTIGGTAAAAGLLWCGIAVEHTPHAGPQLDNEQRLRPTETAIVLGALAALFALFVVIQVHYLFGGDDRVRSSIGLTYADYARRGFFELVAVAALLLPVLLLADWARTRSWRSLTTFRVLVGVLAALLLVVVASAFERLRIYIDAYGLTALRFYAAALLAWLATVFVALLWALLRERRDQFVIGAVLTATVALVALVALNPHGTIAGTNLARAEQGHEFDTAHALSLSPDATPTLVAGIDVLPPNDACEVARTLLARWDDPDSDLRSWNWSRTAAASAVEADRDALQSACD